MPLPKTRDIGKIMKKLNKEEGRSKEQKIAIALSVARKAGAKIPTNNKTMPHKSGKTEYKSKPGHLMPGKMPKEMPKSMPKKHR